MRRPRFAGILPAVMLVQIGGGLLALAAKLVAVRLVQQLLFEALHRKVIVPLAVGQQMSSKQRAQQQQRAHASPQHTFTLRINGVGLLCQALCRFFSRLLKEGQEFVNVS